MKMLLAGVWISILLSMGLSLVLLANRRAPASYPSTESLEAGGSHAFSELLRLQGYRTRVDGRLNPLIKPEELAIQLTILESERGSIFDDERQEKTSLNPELLAVVRNGGRLIQLVFAPEYATTQTSLDEVQEEGTTRKPLKVSRLPETLTIEEKEEVTAIELFTSDQTPFVKLFPSREGVVMRVLDASGISNAHIGTGDNAAFYASLVKRMAPGKEIVFLEAPIGNIHSETLFQAVGSWANVAFWQLLLTLATVFITLGMMFGRPKQLHLANPGARSLMGAIGYLFQRQQLRDLAEDYLRAEILSMNKDTTFETPPKDRVARIAYWNEKIQAAIRRKHHRSRSDRIK